MLVSKEQHEILITCFNRYKDEEAYGVIQLAENLDEVLGEDDSPVKSDWSAYSALFIEWIREEQAGPEPVIPHFAIEDSPNASKAELEAALKEALAGRNLERSSRKIRNESGIITTNGRSKIEFLGKLVIERFENGVLIVYCIACDKKAVGRSKGRILLHACDCYDLKTAWPVEYHLAQTESSKSAHEERIKAGNLQAVRPPGKRNAPSKEFRIPAPSLPSASTSNKHDLEISDDEDQAPGPSKSAKKIRKPQKPLIDGKIYNAFRPTSPLTTLQQAAIDDRLLRLIVCACLPLSLLDNTFFWDFVISLNGQYSVPDRSSFFESRLTSEVQLVLKKLFKMLTKQEHLTVSFDGWSSRRNDEVYTAHIILPDRRVFFVEGFVMNGISCTGEVLRDRLTETITKFGAKNLSAIVSDTTGNVKETRRLITEEYKWILDLPDPCHQFNLLAKDIMEGKSSLEGFLKTMLRCSTLANYFSHSNTATDALRKQLAFQTDTRGIQSPGTTRFSTYYTCVDSIIRCMDAIGKCIEAGTIRLTGASAIKMKVFLPGGEEHYAFMQQASFVRSLLQPIARALKSVEGNNVTLSDVFNCWIGIAVGYQECFRDNSSTLSQHRNVAFTQFNKRFDIFLKDCSHEVFLSAYFLDNDYQKDQVLRLDLPPRHELTRENMPELLVKLIRIGHALLNDEQYRDEIHNKEDANVLTTQIIAYAYGQAPFTLTAKVVAGKDRLFRWKCLQADSGDSVLAVLAVKLFSVCPSEINDERQISVFTRYNTSLRNNLAPTTIIKMAQLRDHYIHGFEKQLASDHDVHLVVNRSQVPVLQQILPTPTLADLSHENNQEIEITAVDFSSHFRENEGEENEEEEGTEVEVVRGELVVLNLEKIVNLTASSLVERFSEGKGKGKGKEKEKEKGVAIKKAVSEVWDSKSMELEF